MTWIEWVNVSIWGIELKLEQWEYKEGRFQFQNMKRGKEEKKSY